MTREKISDSLSVQPIEATRSKIEHCCGRQFHIVPDYVVGYTFARIFGHLGLDPTGVNRKYFHLGVFFREYLEAETNE